MTTIELEGAIEAALGVVPFEPPVTVAYTEAVKDELRKALGQTAVLDVMHQAGKALVVEARLDATVAKLVLPLV